MTEDQQLELSMKRVAMKMREMMRYTGGGLRKNEQRTVTEVEVRHKKPPGLGFNGYKEAPIASPLQEPLDSKIKVSSPPQKSKISEKGVLLYRM